MKNEAKRNEFSVERPVMRTMYAIFSGRNYTEGHFVCVFDKKKDAINAIRGEGYKYNKEQNLYLTDRMWYRIEKCGVNDLYE